MIYQLGVTSGRDNYLFLAFSSQNQTILNLILFEIQNLLLQHVNVIFRLVFSSLNPMAMCHRTSKISKTNLKESY